MRDSRRLVKINPKISGDTLEGSHALASRVNRVAAGHAGPPRDDLRSPRPSRGLDDERANSGEVRNADAVICLAEGNPAAALAAIQEVLDGTAPVVGYRSEERRVGQEGRS